MALLSTLSKTIAEAEGLDETSVSWIARHLREAGLISQAGRGRGAAHMTASDAANLLIAVNGAETPKRSEEAVKKFRSLEVGVGPICKTKSSLLSGLCGEGVTFGVAFERLISASMTGDGGVSALELELSNIPSNFKYNTVSIGFGRPRVSSFIYVSSDGPLNPNNPFSIYEDFKSVMYAHYWDVRNLWSQSSGRRDLTVISGDVLKKVGHTLSN